MSLEYSWNKAEAVINNDGYVIGFNFLLVGTDGEYSHSFEFNLTSLPAETYDNNIVFPEIILTPKLVEDYTIDEIRNLANLLEERFGWKEAIRTRIKSDKAQPTTQSFNI